MQTNSIDKTNSNLLVVMGDEEVLLLRQEVERLTRELDQASSEKIQSAQYGLVLLEEKKTLEQKCEELESLYENTRHELDITVEVSPRPMISFLRNICLNL